MKVQCPMLAAYGSLVNSHPVSPLINSQDIRPKLNVTQILHVPFSQQRKFDITRNEQPLKSVVLATLKKFNVEIDVSTSKATKMITFSISGKEEAVERSKKELLDALSIPVDSLLTGSALLKCMFQRNTEAI
jgi:hypothetical protein